MKDYIDVTRLIACSVLLMLLSACTHFLPYKNENSTGQEVESTDVTNTSSPEAMHDSPDAGGWYEVGTGAPVVADSLKQMSLAEAVLARRLEDLEAATSRYRDDSKLENMDALGRSNYTSFLEETVVVESTVVVFADDSMILNTNGKERVARLAEISLPGDIFRVIGCSHGTTRIENGNEVLAENRARRVAQELYFLGVPVSRVLPEGCWSSNRAEADHPSRGVVLSLFRRGDGSLVQVR